MFIVHLNFIFSLQFFTFIDNISNEMELFKMLNYSKQVKQFLQIQYSVVLCVCVCCVERSFIHSVFIFGKMTWKLQLFNSSPDKLEYTTRKKNIEPGEYVFVYAGSYFSVAECFMVVVAIYFIRKCWLKEFALTLNVKMLGMQCNQVGWMFVSLPI